MKRRDFCKLTTLATIGHVGMSHASAFESSQQAAAATARERFVMDMVHITPGEKAPKTAFLDPKVLAGYGYNSQVVLSLVEGVPKFRGVPGVLDTSSDEERLWVDGIASHIEEQIDRAHAAGLKCFAWMQLVVFPQRVVGAFRDEICDDRGRIDVLRPKTQWLLRLQLQEVFERLPNLDGLIIRTGEVYLHDLPYHASTASGTQRKVQGSTAILHGEQSHVTLLQILRESVCAGLGRHVFYRTWDFGDNFHTNPAYYLRVTDNIKPHAKLVFSVKHQKGDFHQLTRFNPTLMIGEHRQIVEVQCQREGYGKGAHPYYIGKGVIEGWEEYAWMMKQGEPQGLRDIIGHPLYAGTWTWSRGGGWDGPYIVDEIWCTLNAYVLCKFSQDPGRTEAQILEQYARSLGLRGEDVSRFAEIQELSCKAVLRGQLSNLGVRLDVWWTRDDKLGAPDLRVFLERNLVEEALAEKAGGMAMWHRMDMLAKEIRWPNSAIKDSVLTSIAYGICKYEVIRQGWTVLLVGLKGASTGVYDWPRIKKAIEAYDIAWTEWRALKASHQSCASLYKDLAFGDKPGLGAAIDAFRKPS